MLKHTAVVRPSGWRRKASKERCCIWLFYAIGFLFLSRLAISLSMSFEIFCSVTCA